MDDCRERDCSFSYRAAAACPLLEMGTEVLEKISIPIGLFGTGNWRIARIANPYGAGQDLSRGLGAVSIFLYKALHGEPITIWGDGEVVRDYIHISDTAKCLVKMATADRTDEFIFNVGSGIGHSLNQVVSELEHHLRRKIEVTRTDMRSFDVPTSVLCIEKARNVLGWSPSLSFSEGLDRTIRDFNSGRAFSTLD